MRRHLQILGAIYFLLGGASGAVALLIGLLTLTGRISAEPVVPIIFAMLTLWLLRTGLGLWQRRRGARVLAAVTASVLLVMLNVMLLFADEGKYSASAGQTVFHSTLIAIGLYTLVVVLHPSAKAEMV